MNQNIKKFIKHDKLLCYIALITAGICIIYLISYDSPEWYPGLGKAFDFIYNLCLAYLGSFIFYIVQVYIPNEQKKKKLLHNIYDYLLKIYTELYSANNNLELLKVCIDKDYGKFNQLPNKVISKENEVENEKKLFEINIIKSMNWLNSNISVIEGYMNNIYSINIANIGSDLEVIDNKIQNWIEMYRMFKNKRSVVYHNGIPENELIYYECMIEMVSRLKDIYKEEDLIEKIKIIST